MVNCIIRVFSLFILILFSNISRAEIITITDLSKIEEKLINLQKKYNPAKILTVFAIENTLLRVSEAAFWEAEENKDIIKNSLRQVKGRHLLYLREVLLTNYKHELVDKELPKLFEKIIASSSPIVAISDTLTGKFNDLARFEIWLAQYLNKFGLDFSSSFSKITELRINSSNHSHGSDAYFYKGILSTGGRSSNSSKVSAIINFFIVSNYTPDVLIVVDDDFNTLKRLEEQISKFSTDGTLFIGYHYNKPMKEASRLSSNKVAIFWKGLAEKMNKVKISSKKNKINKNPYDE